MFDCYMSLMVSCFFPSFLVDTIFATFFSPSKQHLATFWTVAFNDDFVKCHWNYKSGFELRSDFCLTWPRFSRYFILVLLYDNRNRKICKWKWFLGNLAVLKYSLWGLRIGEKQTDVNGTDSTQNANAMVWCHEYAN